MSLDLGAVVGRVVLETVEFDSAYTRSIAKMRSFGAEAQKGSGGVRVLDKSMLGAAASADKATASIERTSQSTARKAAADQKAAASAERHTMAMGQVRAALGTVAGESAKVQQATLRLAASQERLNALQESGAATSRQLYLAQANLIGAQRSLATAQKEGAVAGGKFGESMKSGLKLAGSLGLLIGAIEIGKKAVEFIGAGKELTDSLNRVEGASNATAAQMKAARAEAIALGHDLKVPGATAVDAADAIKDLVQSGMTLPRALQSARSALLLASAANVTTADSARILGDVLDEFHLPASQAAKTASALAAGANLASGGLLEMFNAFKYAGSLARAVGLGVDDVAAAVATLAKAGLVGDLAGTGLAMMFQKLAKESPSGTKALRDLGVTAWDATGKFEGLPKVIEQLHAAQKRMGPDSQRFLADISTAFGARAVKTVAAFASQGVESYDRFLAAIKSGDVQKYANLMNRGIGAGARQLSKEFTAAGIDLYQKFEPQVAAAVMWIGTNLPKAVQTAGGVLAPFATFVGGALSSAWHLLGGAVSVVSDVLGPVVHVLEALKTPLGAVATLVLAMWVAFRLGAFVGPLIENTVAKIRNIPTAAAEMAAGVQASVTRYVASMATIGESTTGAAATAGAGMAAIGDEAAVMSGAVVAEGETAALGWSAMLGPLAAVGIGIALVISMFHKSSVGAREAAQATKDTAAAAKSFGDVLTQGGTRADLLGNLVKQLADKNVPQNLQAMNKALLGEGFKSGQVSGSSFFNAIANGGKTLAEVRRQLELTIRAGTMTAPTGSGVTTSISKSAQLATTLLRDLNAEYSGLSKATVKDLIDTKALAGVSSSVDKVAQSTTVGSKAAAQYAAMMGIYVDKNGVAAVSSKTLQAAITTVSHAYSTATATGAEYLNAVSAFSQSSGTAADRAALIGATLKAANGDALAFAGSMATASAADHQFATDVASAAKAVGKSGVSVRTFMKSIVDLKHGTIDYASSAAAPLISDLQSMQTAAMGAASAAYQHARATMSGKDAADQAYNVYRSMTSGSLIDQRKKLGLTADEAKRLADRYFGMPKSVKTLIEQQGANPVVDVLNRIGQQLAFLTGHPWAPKVDAKTEAANAKAAALQRTLDGIIQHTPPVLYVNNQAALAELSYLQAQIDALHGKTITNTLYLETHTVGATAAGSQSGSVHHATGGTVRGPGTGTSDSILAMLSNGEEVINAKQASKHRRLLKAINAGMAGYATGGTVTTRSSAALSLLNPTVTTSGATTVGQITRSGKDYVYKGIRYASQRAADNARTRDEQKSAGKPESIHATLPGVTGIASVIAGQKGPAAAAMRDLSRAVSEAFQLKGVEKNLALVKTQIAGMTAFRDTVKSNLAGGFDLTKFGSVKDFIGGIGGATGTNTKFAGQINKLRKEGLNKDLLGKLIAAGPNASLDSFAAGSKTDISAANKAYGKYAGSLTLAGNAAVYQQYGTSIAERQHRQRGLQGQQSRLVHSIDGLVRRLGKETGHNVTIQIGDEKVAQYVLGSHGMATLIDELGNHIKYGRNH